METMLTGYLKKMFRSSFDGQGSPHVVNAVFRYPCPPATEHCGRAFLLNRKNAKVMFKNWFEEIPTTGENREIVRARDWVALLLTIPVLNIVLLFVWALTGKEDRYPASQVNFARAVLLYLAATVFAVVVTWLLLRWLAGLAAK